MFSKSKLALTITTTLISITVSCGGDNNEKSAVSGSGVTCVPQSVKTISWSITLNGRFTDAQILSRFYNLGIEGCSATCANMLQVSDNIPMAVSTSASADGIVSGEVLGSGATVSTSYSENVEVSDPAVNRNNLYQVTGQCQVTIPYAIDTRPYEVGQLQDPYLLAMADFHEKNCSRYQTVVFDNAINNFRCVSPKDTAKPNYSSRPRSSEGSSSSSSAGGQCPAQGGCPEGQFKQTSGYCATYVSYPAYAHCS